MIGKILIVDDVSTNRIVFKVKLASAGYQVLMASDGAGCLAQARADAPDLILLDSDLPDRPVVAVLQDLRSDPRTRRVPVVVFTSDAAPERRLQALRAGADDVLMRPIDDQTLLARLRNLLRAQDSAGEAGLAGLAEPPVAFDGPGLIAMVSNRPERALRMKAEMKPVSRDRIVHVSESAVFGTGTEAALRPDVYLIEADLDGPGSGLRLMSEILSRPDSRHAACLILYDRTPPLATAMAYDLGAHDLVDESVQPAELAQRLARLVRRKREGDALRGAVQDGLRQAIRDHLTGLHNRRYAMAHLQVLARQADLGQQPFVVMLVDLDRFKSVNDRFGHAAGDAVLVEVARRLTDSLRAEDMVARVGGEEFLIALPGAGIEDARTVAARLCEAIRDAPVLLPTGQRIHVTASIGVALVPVGEPVQDQEMLQGVIDRADRALLTAKASGRNQVTFGRSAA
jgi:two-component system cell cycle response regulator